MTGRNLGPMRTVVRRSRRTGHYRVTLGDGSVVYVDGQDAFIDTLECGHTVTRYTRSIRRRCEQCAVGNSDPTPALRPPSPTSGVGPNARARDAREGGSDDD